MPLLHVLEFAKKRVVIGLAVACSFVLVATVLRWDFWTVLRWDFWNDICINTLDGDSHLHFSRRPPRRREGGYCRHTEVAARENQARANSRVWFSPSVSLPGA